MSNISALLSKSSMRVALEENEEEYTTGHDSSLWVDKYTSRKFFDLLTDDVTNRNVLTWLKSWDELVFPQNERVDLKIPDSLVQKQFFRPYGQNQSRGGLTSNSLSTFNNPQEIYSFKNK